MCTLTVSSGAEAGGGEDYIEIIEDNDLDKSRMKSRSMLFPSGQTKKRKTPLAESLCLSNQNMSALRVLHN